MKAIVLTICMLLSASAESGVSAARLERAVAQENKTRPRRVTTTKPASRAPAQRKSGAKATASRAKDNSRNRAGDKSRKSGAKATASRSKPTARNSAGDIPRKSSAKATAGRAAPEIEMVHVPGGSFLMGSPENETGHNDKEKPRRSVTVRGFYIGKYELTQAQWRAVMGGNPSHFKGDDLPVENVSWNDAKDFCRRLSEMTGENYRLPTEAEWEYACRAKTDGAYAGDLDSIAWYGNILDVKTHPVGRKQPNAFGIYDMHGNVWEWCEDDWHKSYANAPGDGSAWVDKPKRSSYRVVRGGDWNDNAVSCRSANRSADLPGNRLAAFLGFRIVKEYR
ncbi:MAG TPA: SUMF1/EgtB/PvdO family nonheme iron enzyme [Blastocatellia bacterium]|nr:SUMF1/EgtB/PvdO family nonheme iron enzyme [Blastocatellia bacterium]